MMKKLSALCLGLMSLVALVLIFTPNAFAVPETVTVKQTYLLDDTNQTVLDDQLVAPGATFEPATTPGEGYTFAFYIVNGVISDAEEGASFVVGTYLNLVAVYRPANKFAVVFVDVSGEIIKHNDKLAQYVLSGEDATAPTSLPTKKNYVVSETNPWSDSFENVTDNKVITLQYELSTSATFTITYDETPQVVAYNEIVTLTSETDVLWLEDGRTIWYGQSYSFSALSDRDITTELGAAPTSPIVSMQEIADLRADHRSFLAQVYVPSGELLEVGFLRGTEHEVTFANKANHIASSLVPETNEFIVSIPDTITDNIRAYALFDGETILEVYSFVEPIPELIKLPTPNMSNKSLNDLNTELPWFDLGGEYGIPVGYSGQMRINYVADGYPTETQVVSFSTGRMNIPKSFWDTLVKGVTYQIKVQAIGNGTTHSDSDLSDTNATVFMPLPNLTTLTLDVSGNTLTWNEVTDAEFYEVYLDDEFIATVEDLTYEIDPIDLELAYGIYEVKVIAKADGYSDSEDFGEYQYINVSAQVLDAPTNLAINSGILSWNNVANADGYRVTVNGMNYVVSTSTTFDLDSLYLTEGTYQVSLVARGDGGDYLDSEPVMIDYIGTVPPPQLTKPTIGDFGGNFLNGYSDGHYAYLPHGGHAVYSQEGFSGTFLIEVRTMGGDLIRSSADYEFVYGMGENFIQRPGTTSGKEAFLYLANLTSDVTYQIHFYMVANEGYRNSDPIIIEFTW